LNISKFFWVGSNSFVYVLSYIDILSYSVWVVRFREFYGSLLIFLDWLFFWFQLYRSFIFWFLLTKNKFQQVPICITNYNFLFLFMGCFPVDYPMYMWDVVISRFLCFSYTVILSYVWEQLSCDIYMYIYMCIYICVYIYVYIYIYIYIYMYIYIYINIYVCINIHVCIYIHVYIYVNRYLRHMQVIATEMRVRSTRPPTAIPMIAPICIWMWIYTCILYIYFYIHINVYIYMCTYIHICVYAHTYIYINYICNSNTRPPTAVPIMAPIYVCI
jgi:hypothetical protein